MMDLSLYGKTRYLENKDMILWLHVYQKINQSRQTSFILVGKMEI